MELPGGHLTINVTSNINTHKVEEEVEDIFVISHQKRSGETYYETGLFQVEAHDQEMGRYVLMVKNVVVMVHGMQQAVAVCVHMAITALAARIVVTLVRTV